MLARHTHICLWAFVVAGNLPLVYAAASTSTSTPMPTTYTVTAFGAKADGQTKDTAAIQKAIDACAANGGGTVYFPPGTYLAGSLHLRSQVALSLDHAATLKASTEPGDFDPYEKLGFKNEADRETSFFHYALLWGEDLEHVAIVGTGAIDGNRPKRGGPKPIALKRCQGVTIRDLTIRNAPNYAISLLGTDDVQIDGVTIVNGYSDGIDPDSCRHVRIANCRIDAWDDAIVPKASYSLGVRRAVEYLTVTSCDLASNRNTFKLGTESGGGFRHIVVSNCVMHARATGGPPVSGISLESVDGGDIEGVTISNVAMVNVRAPLFLRLGNRGRDQAMPTPGTLCHVVISNIVATGASLACPVAGIPGHAVRDVTLDNIQITFAGGGTLEQANVQVPECEDKYPQASMFGILPAYGLYCRHVEGLRLRDITLRLQAPDHRPALVCDAVARVLIDSWEADRSEGAVATMRFRGVKKALIGNCLFPESRPDFIQVMDGSASEITFQGNGK